MRLELPSKRVAVNLLCSGALSPVSASEQGLHFWRPDKKKAAKAAWHITRPYTKASLGLVLFVRVVRVAVFFQALHDICLRCVSPPVGLPAGLILLSRSHDA